MICDICKEKPAIYGDGITWARCAECEYNYNKENKVLEPIQQGSVVSDGIPHQTVPGLTSIIIPVYMVNYSLFHYTGNCINSVREHTDIDGNPYEIIIVDNASSIQPPNLNAYYAAKVIQNKENLGFTKAVNQGIRAAFGEYIVVLSNDVQVFWDWLPNMKKALEAVDLVMAHPMYSLTEPFARAIEAQLASIGRKHFDDIPGGKDFSCVAFKKELFEKLGDDYLFDERLFNYCSDSDLLDRMDRKGLKYTMSDKVFTSHISDATGYSLPETPEIMNKDKEIYAQIKAERDNMETEVGVVKVDNSTAGVSEQPQSQNIEFIRTQVTGDRIFLLKDNKTHPIKDPATLEALGGKFGMEIVIPKEEFDTYSMGELITIDNISSYV